MSGRTTGGPRAPHTRALHAFIETGTLDQDQLAALTQWIHRQLHRLNVPVDAHDDTTQDLLLWLVDHRHQLGAEVRYPLTYFNLRVEHHVADLRRQFRRHRDARPPLINSLAAFTAPAIDEAIYESEALSTLTARERDVATLTSAGHSDADIAQQLDVHPNTVYKIRRRAVRNLWQLHARIEPIEVNP